MNNLEKKLNKVDNINLIRKITWSMVEKSGLSYDDLFGEACLAYYKALPEYTPEKGAISTYMFMAIKNHLLNYIYKEQKHQTADIGGCENIAAPLASDFNIYSLFTGKALQLVEMVLKNKTIDFNGVPKKIRGEIVEALRQEGWKWQDIWATFSEIKEKINTN